MGGERKAAMYCAFVLIIPSRLGDIQAAAGSSAGLWWEGYQRVAGERLLHSPVSSALRRVDEGQGGGWECGC